MDERKIELIDLIRAVWRQKWIILVTLAVAIGVAWLLSEVPEPTYRARTSLLLLPPLASDLDAESIASSLPTDAYEELATSSSVLERIREQFDSSPVRLPTRLQSIMSVTAESYANQQSDSNARLVSLHLSITGANPDDLTAIAQSWIDAFSESYGSFVEDRTSQSYDYILDIYQSAEDDLAQADNERVQLLAGQPIELLKANRDDVRKRLAAAQEELQAVQLEADTASNYLATQDLRSRNGVSAVMLSSEISPYTVSGALLLGLSADQFTALLDARIATLTEQVNMLESEFQAKQAQIDEATAQLDEMDRTISQLTESVTFLSTRLRSAQLAQAEKPDLIRVIEEPIVSANPIAPRKTQNMAVAGILGLILGTLFAFFVDYLQRVRARERLAVEARDSKTDDEGSPPSPSSPSEA